MLTRLKPSSRSRVSCPVVVTTGIDLQRHLGVGEHLEPRGELGQSRRSCASVRKVGRAAAQVQLAQAPAPVGRWAQTRSISRARTRCSGPRAPGAGPPPRCSRSRCTSAAEGDVDVERQRLRLRPGRRPAPDARRRSLAPRRRPLRGRGVAGVARPRTGELHQALRIHAIQLGELFDALQRRLDLSRAKLGRDTVGRLDERSRPRLTRGREDAVARG